MERIDLAPGVALSRLVYGMWRLAHHVVTSGDLAYLQERGLPPMAWSPLAGGTVFATSPAPLHAELARQAERHGVDMAAVAVAWLLRHLARILPVLGTNDLARIAAIGDAARVVLDRQDWFTLYTHALGHEVP